MKIIICFFIFFALHTWGQIGLEQINVNALKEPSAFSFSDVDFVEEEDLSDTAHPMIYESLENISGLVMGQNGGPGGRTSFFLRGTEARHLSFTLDGMRLNDTSNVDRQFDATFILSHHLSRLEVYKGPQAVLFGSDSFGGLIEMQTKKGEHAPESSLKFTVGSRETLGLSLVKDWRLKKNQGTFTLSRFQTEGISRLNKKRFNATESDAAEISQLTTSSSHELTEKITLDFLSLFNFGKAEQDGFQVDSDSDLTENTQFLIQQKTTYHLQAHSILSFRSGFNQHQRKGILEFGNYFFKGDIFQNELIYKHKTEKMSFLSGVSLEKERASFENPNQFQKSLDLLSLFQVGRFPLGSFDLQVGLRWDYHSLFGSFFTTSSGIKKGEVSFQYSKGIKTPSLYQLYGPPIETPVGNPSLQPEENQSLELSWKKKLSLGHYSMTLFQNRLFQLINYNLTEGYINQDAFTVEGLEVSFEQKTFPFQTFFSLTHQQFKDTESTILRRPYNIAILGLSYFYQEKFEASLKSRFYSDRKDRVSGNVLKLDGYEVVDFSFHLFQEKSKWSFQVKNLLNREYEEIYGYSTMPRSFFLNSTFFF